MLSQLSGAIFDKDRQHRFLLWRFWNDSPRMMFVGLNPSTANEIEDDPTIRRLCSFAQKWGYGGLYACNLFSYITPYPKELLKDTRYHAADIPAINMISSLVVLTVCGWGDGIKNIENSNGRVRTICSILKAPMCFGLTDSGNPKHPLYLPGESELIDFELK